MSGMPLQPCPGQVVTVFRSRLRPEAGPAYAEDAPLVLALARSMPGFVDAKGFVAEDGERVTLVTFADRATHEAWRDHPEHRAAQRRGIDGYYATYSIQVGTTSYASAFERPGA
jgi:heme-degrading monooxygenase HmoA